MVNYKFEAYSIAGITILIAGLLKVYIYYKCFGISILPFLESSEILTIFFDNLLSFLGFLTLNYIVIGLIYNNSKFDGEIVNKSFKARLDSLGFFEWAKVGYFVVFVLGFFFLAWFRNSKYFYEFYLWIGLLSVAFYLNPLVYFQSIWLIKKRNFSENKMSIIFLLAAINLFVFASFSGLNEFFIVKSKQYYVGTEFELDNKQKIISTVDYYYIGKTKQYAFFYDKNKKETDVIPVSRFIKMKFIM